MQSLWGNGRLSGERDERGGRNGKYPTETGTEETEHLWDGRSPDRRIDGERVGWANLGPESCERTLTRVTTVDAVTEREGDRTVLN